MATIHNLLNGGIGRDLSPAPFSMEPKKLEVKMVINTDLETVCKNIQINLKTKHPVLQRYYDVRPERLNIIAGGPSINQTLPEIKKRYDNGEIIVAVNGAHDWLLGHDIVPHACMFLDCRPEVIEFVKNPHKKTKYYVASQCHPKVLRALKKHDVVLFHAHQDIGEDKAMPPGFMKISGGSTAALRWINLGYVLGFRDFHYFGLDSCYQDSKNDHAYKTPLPFENEIMVTCAGREFKTSVTMAGQAQFFEKMVQKFGKKFKVEVHGDGLTKHILDNIKVPQYEPDNTRPQLIS